MTLPMEVFELHDGKRQERQSNWGSGSSWPEQWEDWSSCQALKPLLWEGWV